MKQAGNRHLSQLPPGLVSPPQEPKQREDTPRRAAFGLLVHRPGWRFSLLGKLVVSTGLALGLLMAILFVHPWLCVTRRVPAEFLVIEGWIGVGGLQQAVGEYHRGGYTHVLTSGSMTLYEGDPKQIRTYAHWSAEELVRQGVPAGIVTPIPSWIHDRDRTFHSAVAVRNWFLENHIPVTRIDVVSLGPHARRTRLMYEKAFNGEVKVGIIAARETDYDPRHWWRTSEGVREVVGEALAYAYARLLFHPSAEETGRQPHDA